MDSGVIQLITRLFELDSPDNVVLLVGSNHELIVNLGAFQLIRDLGGSIRQVIDEWLADEPAQTSEAESEASDDHYGTYYVSLGHSFQTFRFPICLPRFR